MKQMKNYTGIDGIELALFRSPVEFASENVELLVAECLVYASFSAGVVHAYRNGAEHLLFLLVAFTAASVVDPFCLISENIRNYFHSHASVLLWDRHVAPWQFPLFACIAYVPGALVWSLNLHVIPETLLTIFVASWTFYGFDLFACRWLLYQWHVSDPLYTARTECVPLASSMWVMTYAGTASFLARLSYHIFDKVLGVGRPKMFDLDWWACFFVSTIVFLPLHIIPISVFYFPSVYFGWGKEYHVVWGFGLSGLIGAAFTHQFFRKPPDQVHIDEHLDKAFLQSLIWFSSLSGVLLFLDPHQVVSTSVHQPYGGLNAHTSALCKEEESYLFGLSRRRRYVCDDELQYWQVIDDPQSKSHAQPGDQWYTIQGLPMNDGFFVHFATCLLFALVQHLTLLILSVHAGLRQPSQELKKRL